MRITTFNQFQANKYYMNQLQQKAVNEQIQIATGKQYKTISDDPIRANQAMLVQESMGRIGQYIKNIDDADTIVSKVEQTLGQAINLIQSLKEEGLRASNGTYSASDRNTVAKTIEQGIQQLVNLANQKYLGKYIFSGEVTQSPSYAYDGITATYQGNGNVPEIQTSAYQSTKTSFTGDDAFQMAFDALIDLRDQVQSGSAATISTALASVDAALDEVGNKQAEAGVRMQSLESIRGAFQFEQLQLEEKKATIEEVDFTKIVMEHSQTQQMYQAVIMSSQRMNQLSILNFM
ncbi:flagellar hook-associated protein FlgL (plasmid) [Pontibacillus sp. ALD_SL1]|uniref:flagellar hook-associated protein FlgL n=1 Tax=Pontibacillus sp. ALD_SL1 TaxID=2777185 RepID=UPI001A95BD5B|nr:flagellar hook-associated protein FlgL [Pontibacillus sp. ALD_SL1]QST03025.1 flagellar hook-associated protein FlgL [Pontibacillus sp. ALD_SL1]